jgi:hypothetical protein
MDYIVEAAGLWFSQSRGWSEHGIGYWKVCIVRISEYLSRSGIGKR